jgi:hypothetical protein
MENLTVKITRLKGPLTAEYVMDVYDTIVANTSRIFRIGRKAPTTMFLVASKAPQVNGPAMLMVHTPWSDTHERSRYLATIQEMASETKAVAVVSAGEVWISMMARPEGVPQGELLKAIDEGTVRVRPARDDPDRLEGVQVTLASTITHPRNYSRFALINRSGSRPTLEAWRAFPDGTPQGALYDLLPVSN